MHVVLTLFLPQKAKKAQKRKQDTAETSQTASEGSSSGNQNIFFLRRIIVGSEFEYNNQAMPFLNFQSKAIWGGPKKRQCPHTCMRTSHCRAPFVLFR